uniref:DUF306 domain-containing protein n=1 Tax=Grammatophora oceanica TaxID=210454 RepID=A0A6U5NBI1_9STRA|mmetsp:Transcript_44132/g.65451  ORF Transcript_44132/g.65451 Transcript_44132/m.65451 type:complete len:147 (+) Transcript_44132:78-518(+)|eukprot:CAMPEP_0194033790 /NCGR_PEP_ID=MMETSP0009_2-20130614/6328_1 /TAXON_ID=210454 /ORGANISM="Grammatophora oceanica, Strain CCMP 410" /LENGTH=146 /DNA_ID=CAMNT_0038674515 /DNA_START=78 /DNA_END=518 /DNA_ORIENTATION=+
MNTILSLLLAGLLPFTVFGSITDFYGDWNVIEAGALTLPESTTTTMWVGEGSDDTHLQLSLHVGNRFMGSIEIVGETSDGSTDVVVHGFASTRMMVRPELEEMENFVVEEVTKMTHLSMEGETLLLTSDDGTKLVCELSGEEEAED